MPESTSSGLSTIKDLLLFSLMPVPSPSITDAMVALSLSYIVDELLMSSIRSLFTFLVTILLVATVDGIVVAVGTGTCCLLGK